MRIRITENHLMLVVYDIECDAPEDYDKGNYRDAGQQRDECLEVIEISREIIEQ